MALRYPFDQVQPVTQEYGDNPGDYARFGMIAHNGIDFGCVSGTNVLASASGTVEHATFDDGGYGFYVTIKHAGGLTSVYAHLSQIRVQPGVMVKTGQLIGQSGSTGNSTGPHLHFEVREQGKENNGYHGAVDPRPLIEWPGVTKPVIETPLSATTYVVKAGELNVRGGPGLGCAIVGALHFGDQVQVVEIVIPEVWGRLVDGRWIALTYNGSKLAAVK